jgi:hypothetical protein
VPQARGHLPSGLRCIHGPTQAATGKPSAQILGVVTGAGLEWFDCLDADWGSLTTAATDDSLRLVTTTPSLCQWPAHDAERKPTQISPHDDGRYWL